MYLYKITIWGELVKRIFNFFWELTPVFDTSNPQPIDKTPSYEITRSPVNFSLLC